MRSLLFWAAVGLMYGQSADAALLVYNFDSAATGLHGEITFNDSNAQFAAGGTVSVVNGGITTYFFETGSAYWDLNDLQAIQFSITFAGTGTTPDDITSYLFDTSDTVSPFGSGEQLTMLTSNSSNGGHSLSVNSTGARDGTFSLGETAARVPEPASLWLLSGVAVWGLARRRRQLPVRGAS